MSIGGLTEQDLQEMTQFFILMPKIESVILFGSRAKGNFRAGSDVDLALKGSDVDFDVTSKASHLLNEVSSTLYTFDILNYNTITNVELKDHIDRVGIEIYKNTDEAILGFIKARKG